MAMAFFFHILRLKIGQYSLPVCTLKKGPKTNKKLRSALLLCGCYLLLLMCSSRWKDWLTVCLFISYYDKCCCYVSNRSIHYREEDQDFTVDAVTEAWRQKINSHFSTQRKLKSSKPETLVSSISSSDIFVSPQPVLIAKIGNVENWRTLVDSIASDISNLVGYLHRVLEPWHWFQVGYIRPRMDISVTSDTSGPWSGSKTMAAKSSRTYLTFIEYIRLTRHVRSLAGFQRRCNPVWSDISDVRHIYLTCWMYLPLVMFQRVCTL
jgi:hypothetical protein